MCNHVLIPMAQGRVLVVLIPSWPPFAKNEFARKANFITTNLRTCQTTCVSRVQVDLKVSQGRFLQQLQITMRANMDGLKKRAKLKSRAKAP